MLIGVFHNIFPVRINGVGTEVEPLAISLAISPGAISWTRSSTSLGVRGWPDDSLPLFLEKLFQQKLQDLGTKNFSPFAVAFIASMISPLPRKPWSDNCLHPTQNIINILFIVISADNEDVG